MTQNAKTSRKGRLIPQSMRRNYDLYLLILPVILYFALMKYLPMYGLQIAFKDFSASRGVWDSAWVGLKHFRRFFSNYQFWDLIRNTIGISLYNLIFAFPIPILFALLLNEVHAKRFKKAVQSITFAPHFLSTVVVAGIVVSFLSPSAGLINHIRALFGGESIYFMIEPEWFKPIYVISEIWQHTGFNSIIYIAALAGIDPQLYEAATVDGASKLQRLWHVTLPCLLPTIIIMLIRQMGSVMDIGFEKVFLLQTDLNRSASSVISTYVYEMGLLGSQFSFSAAVGLFNSVINFGLIIIVNKLAKTFSETSLW